MLRLTVEHADIWNGWFVFEDDDPGPRIEQAVRLVRAACEAGGRDPATLGMTIGVSVALGDALAEGGSIRGTPAQVADRLRAFAALGIDQIQVVLAPSGAPGIEVFADVLRLLDGA